MMTLRLDLHFGGIDPRRHLEGWRSRAVKLLSGLPSLCSVRDEVAGWKEGESIVWGRSQSRMMGCAVPVPTRQLDACGACTRAYNSKLALQLPPRATRTRV